MRDSEEIPSEASTNIGNYTTNTNVDDYIIESNELAKYPTLEECNLNNTKLVMKLLFDKCGRMIYGYLHNNKTILLPDDCVSEEVKLAKNSAGCFKDFSDVLCNNQVDYPTKESAERDLEEIDLKNLDTRLYKAHCPSEIIKTSDISCTVTGNILKPLFEHIQICGSNLKAIVIDNFLQLFDQNTDCLPEPVSCGSSWSFRDNPCSNIAAKLDNNSFKIETNYNGNKQLTIFPEGVYQLKKSFVNCLNNLTEIASKNYTNTYMEKSTTFDAIDLSSTIHTENTSDTGINPYIIVLGVGIMIITCFIGMVYAFYGTCKSASEDGNATYHVAPTIEPKDTENNKRNIGGAIHEKSDDLAECGLA